MIPTSDTQRTMKERTCFTEENSLDDVLLTIYGVTHFDRARHVPQNEMGEQVDRGDLNKASTVFF